MALFSSVFVPLPGFRKLSLRRKLFSQNSSTEPGPQPHWPGSEGRAAGRRQGGQGSLNLEPELGWASGS